MLKKLLIPSAICILTIALLVALLTKKNKENSSSGSATALTPTKASSDNPKPGETDTKTKREREDSDEVLARREMEKEFDELLPAQFPEQFSSLCDATLEPGETLVLGGFRKADGNYEFTFLEAKPVGMGMDGAPSETAGAGGLYAISMRTTGMSREKSSEMGLGSLVSPAKTRIQKSIVLPPGENPALGDFTRVMTMPNLTVRPNTAAIMSIGKDDQAYKISLIVSPGDAGKALRIRTRVESPAGNRY